MRELLEKRLARYEELERMMNDPQVQADSRRFSEVAREQGSLAKLALKYRRFKDLNQEIADLEKMRESSDSEERELAEMELPERKSTREAVWEELLEMTVGGEDAMRNRCQMEIRAGAGGEEAALFAKDLYEMYRKHAENRGWKIEVITTSPTELGGFKEVTLAFEGEGVYRELHYESGGHRVQRVPETESKGRIHTSAATVAVLPEPEDVEIELKPDDYRKDITHASGPGGQHVNKTASAVRLTHHKSGIMVFIQDEKSQHKNLAKAMRVLKTRLYERKREEEHRKRADERKSQVGSGDRSQRIRTYNFPENRVTHHSIGERFNLDQVLIGDLQQITDKLIEHDRNELRSQMGNLD